MCVPHCVARGRGGAAPSAVARKENTWKGGESEVDKFPLILSVPRSRVSIFPVAANVATAAYLSGAITTAFHHFHKRVTPHNEAFPGWWLYKLDQAEGHPHGFQPSPATQRYGEHRIKMMFPDMRCDFKERR